MAVIKFPIPPEAAGYAMEDPNEVIAIKLDGGASRYRRDKINGAAKVSVRWSFDRTEYEFFRAFFRSTLGRGSAPFRIDLVVDFASPVEHLAYFVPGSVRLQEQRGHYYGVTAELEVTQNAIDETTQRDYVALYSYFGPDYATTFPPFEDRLNTMMNTTLPGDWP